MADGGVGQPGGSKGGHIGDMAKIRIAVFADHRIIVVDRIFNAAAGGPANARRRAGIAGVEGRKVEVDAVQLEIAFELGESDTAGAVNQQTVEGDAGAGAYRALDGGLNRAVHRVANAK